MRAVCIGTTVIVVLALTGCAVAPPPGPSVAVMPGHGKSFEAFQADDATCRQFAMQQTGIAPQAAANQSLIGSTALGTVLGAAAGAALGAAAGNPAAGAAIGAASGGVLGAGSGLGAAQYSAGSVQQRYDIGYLQCMSAKGEGVPETPAPQAEGIPPEVPAPQAEGAPPQMPAPQAAYAGPTYAAYPPYPAYPYYYGPAYYGPAYYPAVSVGFGWSGGWGGGWHGGGWHGGGWHGGYH